MAVRSCGLIIGYDECFESESISQVVCFLLRLFCASPQLLSELRVLAYDDMCHLRRYLELRRGTNKIYEHLLSAVILSCDRLHIRNHKLGGPKPGVPPEDDKDLTYCGRFCNPYSGILMYDASAQFTAALIGNAACGST